MDKVRKPNISMGILDLYTRIPHNYGISWDTDSNLYKHEAATHLLPPDRDEFRKTICPL
jgi:hypothetical protein